jgi:hypothetical protein
MCAGPFSTHSTTLNFAVFFVFVANVVSLENQRRLGADQAHTTSSSETQPAEQNREPN